MVGSINLSFILEDTAKYDHDMILSVEQVTAIEA